MAFRSTSSFKKFLIFSISSISSFLKTCWWSCMPIHLVCPGNELQVHFWHFVLALKKSKLLRKHQSYCLGEWTITTLSDSCFSFVRASKLQEQNVALVHFQKNPQTCVISIYLILPFLEVHTLLTIKQLHLQRLPEFRREWF